MDNSQASNISLVARANFWRIAPRVIQGQPCNGILRIVIAGPTVRDRDETSGDQFPKRLTKFSPRHD
jgi:hypothetical protein